MENRLSSLILTLGFAALSFGAIPVRQAANEKQNHYLDSGVFVGGADHGAVSLLNVRHNLKDVERIVLDTGPKVEDPNIDRPTFFHAAIQESPRRIVVDLENVTDSKVTADQIGKLLKTSPFISKVRLIPDYLHKNLTLELDLKAKTQLEVFELSSSGKPGRIVMDLAKIK